MCNHDIDHAGKVHTRRILFDAVQELPKNCVTPESGFDIQRAAHHDIIFNKSQRDAPFLKFILIKNSTYFGTDLLSIIRSLNTVYTAIDICHASYVDCLLAEDFSVCFACT